MWSRLLALLMVLALWPALGETVELAVHLAEHGDLAHDRDDHRETAPLGTDEHGCSALFHLCAAGNVSVASPALGASRPTPFSSISIVDVAPPCDASGCDVPAPPIRPPIA